MTHTCIRESETKDTCPEQSLGDDLYQAVAMQGGKTAIPSARCPQNRSDLQSIASRDLPKQIDKIMKTGKKMIDNAACVTGMRHRKAVNRMTRDDVKSAHPISTELVVQDQALPEWLTGPDGTGVVSA